MSIDTCIYMIYAHVFKIKGAEEGVTVNLFCRCSNFTSQSAVEMGDLMNMCEWARIVRELKLHAI